MDREFECWVAIPGTNGRFAVSNLGRCRKVARKHRFCRTTLTLFVNEAVPLVADYKTRELGWYCYFDGESHFYRRDDLMRLFPDGLAAVDPSGDAAAVKRREDTYRDFAKTS